MDKGREYKQDPWWFKCGLAAIRGSFGGAAREALARFWDAVTPA